MKFENSKNGDMRKLPISRAVFDPVDPGLRCDFIGAIDVKARDLFIAAIKSHRSPVPTASKTALEIGNFHPSPFLEFSNLTQNFHDSPNSLYK